MGVELKNQKQIQVRAKVKKIFMIFLVLMIGVYFGVLGTLIVIKSSNKSVEANTNPQIIIHNNEEEKTVSEDNIEGIRQQAEEDENGLVDWNPDTTTQIEKTISVSANGNMLDELQKLLENGDGTLSALRTIFSDRLLVLSDGEYHFFPIDENLKKHSLLEENLSISENGELEYKSNENVISQKGIDVSKYQGTIDWEKVKADGVDYAFVRAGIRGYETGKIVPDEGVSDNLIGAANVGINVGAYFFSQATTVEEAMEEANVVINAISGNEVSYPIVYDLEKVKSSSGRMNEMTKEEKTEVCLAFCNRIKEAGYIPMIYGNMETFLMLLDMKQLEDIDKWFAYYNTDIYFPYEFSIWQYTESGRVDGIDGDVDMNISFKKFN
ncbi:MAG: glycoside hydrolase family 25 protein [Lachnospiraceae bacterium]|nr:glycoside hydrolase family 25 protein [Lachnospiraceae bacterium]